MLGRKFKVVSLQPFLFDVRQKEPVELSNPSSRTRRRSAHGRGAIHLCIIERRERGNHGDAKCFLAADEITGKNAPGASSVANALHTGEAINGYGEFGTIFEDFAHQRFG